MHLVEPRGLSTDTGQVLLRRPTMFCLPSPTTSRPNARSPAKIRDTREHHPQARQVIRKGAEPFQFRHRPSPCFAAPRQYREYAQIERPDLLYGEPTCAPEVFRCKGGPPCSAQSVPVLKILSAAALDALQHSPFGKYFIYL